MLKAWELINLELSALVSQARQSLVKVSDGRYGAGAGTIWHADGLILTNAHVVRQGAIEVTLPNQQKLPARVLAYSAEDDLAALGVEAHNLPTIELGQANSLQPGQLVLALGHPWGVTGAVSAGPVIAIGRPPQLAHGEFVQAGLQLRPGHSGGPMIDYQGRLVGINTMITGPTVGLAIPSHTVKTFLKQMLV